MLFGEVNQGRHVSINSIPGIGRPENPGGIRQKSWWNPPLPTFTMDRTTD